MVLVVECSDFPVERPFYFSQQQRSRKKYVSPIPSNSKPVRKYNYAIGIGNNSDLVMQ